MCSQRSCGTSTASGRFIWITTLLFPKWLRLCPKGPKVGSGDSGKCANTLIARKPKYGFGRLLDFARAERLAAATHGRFVGDVLAIEEHERSKAVHKPPADAVEEDIKA